MLFLVNCVFYDWRVCAQVCRRRLLGVVHLLQRDSTGAVLELCQLGLAEQCVALRHTADGALRSTLLSLQSLLH